MKTKATLPVEPQRLKKEFPALTAEELDAYVAITKRVLGNPEARSRAMREVIERAKQAEAKAAEGGSPNREELLLIGYLRALSKMQRSTVKRGPASKG